MEQNKKKRAAFYKRVSTDEQAERGYGLDVQDDALRAYATLHNILVDPEHIYIDDGYSGTLPPEQRPALKQLLDHAKQKSFDMVLVPKVDRLARDNFITIGVVRELQRHGIEFKSVTEPFDTSNSFGNFMLQFLGASAEMDRKNIIERTQNGRLAAARDGKWVWGRPAFGYTLNQETGKLEINEQQARWVRQFYEWLVYDRWSLKAIARQANALKIQTKLEADRSKKKTTGLWYPRTLGRMLTNELYTGKTHFRKYKKGRIELKTFENNDYMRNRDDWVEVEAPQIVSQELFSASIVQLRRNSDFAKRKKVRSYMFAGLLHCSKCGFRLRGSFRKPSSPVAKGSRYYHGRILPRDRARSKRCTSCGVLSERKLMSVWHALIKVLSEPESVYERLRAYSINPRSSELTTKHKDVEKALESVAAEKERLTKAYIEIGTITEQDYRKRINALTQRQKALAQEQGRYKHLLISEQEKSHRVEHLKSLYQRLRSRLEEASYETQTAILHLLVNRIDLQTANNIAVVEFNFPRRLLEDSGTNENPPTMSNEARLRDNRSESGPAKNFNLVVEVPLLSEKETRRIDNPTRSKHYKGNPDGPLQKAVQRKAAKMKPLGSVVPHPADAARA